MGIACMLPQAYGVYNQIGSGSSLLSETAGTHTPARLPLRHRHSIKVFRCFASASEATRAKCSRPRPRRCTAAASAPVVRTRRRLRWVPSEGWLRRLQCGSAICKYRMYVVCMDIGNLFQVLAARSCFVPVLSVNRKPNADNMPASSFGAAANAYQKHTTSLFHGMDNHLTYSVCRRVKRIEFSSGTRFRPAARHFYNGQGLFHPLCRALCRIGLVPVFPVGHRRLRVVRAFQPFHKGRNGAFASSANGSNVVWGMGQCNDRQASFSPLKTAFRLVGKSDSL